MEKRAIDHDSVKHPPHYNSGRIEVIEAIEDWKMGFHRGNAIKYIVRAGRKDKDREVEDLQKAVWYLLREIEVICATRSGNPVKKPDAMDPEWKAKK